MHLGVVGELESHGELETWRVELLVLVEEETVQTEILPVVA